MSIKSITALAGCLLLGSVAAHAADSPETKGMSTAPSVNQMTESDTAQAESPTATEENKAGEAPPDDVGTYDKGTSESKGSGASTGG